MLKRGDSMNKKNPITLIYGLSDSRKPYINILKIKNFQTSPLTIDDYNNELCSSLADNNSHINISTDFDKLLLQHKKDWIDYMFIDWPLFKNYYIKTQEHRFNFETVVNKAKYELLKQNNKEKTLTDLIEKNFIKNGCKLGIDLALKNPNISIVFILDDINMYKILEKNHYITGSELRYLYRNRDKIGENILFFRGGEKVVPPWIENPRLWNNYKPTKEKIDLLQIELSQTSTQLNELLQKKEIYENNLIKLKSTFIKKLINKRRIKKLTKFSYELDKKISNLKQQHNSMSIKKEELNKTKLKSYLNNVNNRIPPVNNRFPHIRKTSLVR